MKFIEKLQLAYYYMKRMEDWFFTVEELQSRLNFNRKTTKYVLEKLYKYGAIETKAAGNEQYFAAKPSVDVNVAKAYLTELEQKLVSWHLSKSEIEERLERCKS